MRFNTYAHTSYAHGEQLQKPYGLQRKKTPIDKDITNKIFLLVIKHIPHSAFASQTQHKGLKFYKKSHRCTASCQLAPRMKSLIVLGK